MAHFFSPHTCYTLLLLSVATVLAILAEPVAEADETEHRRAALPARLYEAEGAERRLLDRFQRYLDRAQWDDAFESAARLLQENSSTVVAVGEHRLVSTNEYVHLQLAKLPVEVLAEYRDLVDSLGEAWYRQGTAERDERLLQQIVDELFCSRWGDEALFALGELALERGEYQAARRHWSRMSRELLFPNQRALREQLVLSYPDTNISLADVRARLALVSMYEGDLERAGKEIKTLSAIHGQAVGRLGGQEVILAEALTQMLQQADSWQPRPAKSDWPTYAGSPARTNSRLFAQRTTYKKLWSQSHDSGAKDRPNVFPVVLGKLLIFQNTSHIEALQIDTGERVSKTEGIAFRSAATHEDYLGSPFYMLSGMNHLVFGTTSDSLWGINLKRDGALLFQQQPADENTTRVGTPVVNSDRLWMALQSGGSTARAGILCYDLATQKKIWQRWYCRANTPATDRVKESATNLLTCDSGVIYSCTNLGPIAAIRADDGHPLWIATYPRMNYSHDRGLNPGVFFRGMLFVLPTDSQELLALDATTGIVRWRYRIISPESQILGITDDGLLVSDEGFRTFDLRTGEPKVYERELHLRGHPVIAGKIIYWPTEQTIQAVDIATGELAEETLRLPESGGANLLVSGEYLVAAGPSQLTVYKAQSIDNEPSQVSQNP